MFYVEKDLDYTFKFSHSFYIYCKRYHGRLKKNFLPCTQMVRAKLIMAAM